MSYVSPIEMAAKEARIETENGIYKAVIEAGFTVNKEELKKALHYDRMQYEKGYEDGKMSTGLIMGFNVGELESKMEDFYQRWGFLTPEAVMKMIRGEEA